jgi:ribosomal RNA-processing protein 8
MKRCLRAGCLLLLGGLLSLLFTAAALPTGHRCNTTLRPGPPPFPPAPPPPQKVHSLDLVASAPGVIACNMAATPLASASVDAAVFSLSLMGTDYGSFLAEAHRVLKPGGWLWIAEVRSRFAPEGGAEDFRPFVKALGRLGFKLAKQDASNRMFVTMLLQKEGSGAGGGGIEWPPLRACVYKKR